MAFNAKRAALATRPSPNDISSNHSAGTFTTKAPPLQDRVEVKRHPGAMTARRRAQVIFVLRLTALPNVDPIKALRAVLKVMLRRFGLRCTSVSVEQDEARR
jgi:hypothetical protein